MQEYCWKGDPTKINLLLYGDSTTQTLQEGLSVIGPVVCDGVSYINLRSENVLEMPDGLSETGPELSARVVGIWYTPQEGDAAY